MQAGTCREKGKSGPTLLFPKQKGTPVVLQRHTGPIIKLLLKKNQHLGNVFSNDKWHVYFLNQIV